MTAYDPATHGEVDIIFAGGGTSACVTVGRLARNNPDLRILLIEMGSSRYRDPTVRHPALFLNHLAPGSGSMLDHKAKASRSLDYRELHVLAGGMLGGGSAVNGCMYVRAQAIDFDSWNTPGWASEDIIPLCKKLETFRYGSDIIDKSIHGYDGPVDISDGGYRGQSAVDFMNTVKRMGIQETEDLQDFTCNNSFSKILRYTSPDGQRQDSAYRYIYPLTEDNKHPNLFVLENTRVIRVIFDESLGTPRAAGVEYESGVAAAGSTPVEASTRNVVRATRLVVISAGALATPQILERSGIGNKSMLRKLGIPVIANIPGVGENYQDHQLMVHRFKTNLEPKETLDAIVSGRDDVARLLARKDPILGWNGVDICGKLQMTKKEVLAESIAFQQDWANRFASQPTRPLMLMAAINAYLGDPSRVEPGQYISLACYAAYPWSTGSIHINSKEDVRSGYDFETGYLEHPSDMNVHVWGYKKAREIARRLPYCVGEVASDHPNFNQNSGARLDAIDYAVTDSIMEDIVYSEDDDDILRDWVRKNVTTAWHSLGTCAMKPWEQGGVVDASLNVYGSKGLKVVDLSIVPTNVGANTNNTALVVGEKAAVIIAAELNILL